MNHLLPYGLGAAILLFPCSSTLTGQTPARSADLAAPVRIHAGDAPIDVTTGHAAPYVLDFDGDGKRDLLVGEFGNGTFPNDELPDELAEGWKKGGRFANGRLRIYRNLGSNTEPRFADFEYLQADGRDATVPIT